MINITRSLKKTSTTGLLAAACVLPFCSPVLAGGMDEPWMLDDLKAQLESLNNRVGKLERTYVQKGTELLWVKLSGQVARAALWAGNGKDSDFFNVDGPGTNTRFRIDGGKDFNQDVSVGTVLEAGVISNSAGDLDFKRHHSTVDAGSGNSSFNVSGRKADIFFTSKTYGTLAFGRNLSASTTAASSDLSGTDIVIYSGVADQGAGLEFQKSGVRYFEVQDAFSMYDGPGRTNRVRYDTPTFYGFTLAMAAMDGTGFKNSGDWDAALRYAQELNKIKLAAAVGYTRLERDALGSTPARKNDDDAWFGSASVLFPQGWNVTLAGSRYHEKHTSPTTGADIPDRNRWNSWYAKLGYLFNWCQWGQTAFAIDYGRTNDYLFSTASTNLGVPSTTTYEGNSRADAVGAGVLQHIDAISTELYAGYRNYRVNGLHEVSGVNINPEDINVGFVGARVKI